jgi:hypothetical protein
MKNSADTIGNRIRDLPTRSAVPHSTAPPRTPIWVLGFNPRHDTGYTEGYCGFPQSSYTFLDTTINYATIVFLQLLSN